MLMPHPKEEVDMTKREEVAQEAPLTQGDLPTDKVISAVKGMKADGMSLEDILAYYAQWNNRGENDVVRKQIITAYDLDVAGFSN